ncbi:MAG: DUF4115 domain-containing protein, partial [Chloroflexota bacterium]|nr:DUF4115 domain-containing protein [Chloroflexota bacterium]
ESELEATAEGEAAKLPSFKLMDIPLAPPSWLTPDLVIGALLILALLAFGAWAARQYLLPMLPVLSPSATETPTPSRTAPASAVLPTISPTSLPALTPTPTTAFTPTPYRGVEVKLRVVERAWLKVTVDGEVEFTGVLEKGARRTWSGDESIALRCGNAGGVEVTVNGEYLGPLGERGQVVEREWTKEG